VVKLNIIREKPSVVVITPTTGAECLLDAMESVQMQNYDGEITHHIVVDGTKFSRDYYQVRMAFDKKYPEPKRKVIVTQLMENVGGNGFYGHRVYASFPHLVNQEYVFFLDQDASYDGYHVRLMMQYMLDTSWDWAYSLRNIYDREGKFICKDNCESLGEWPAFMNDQVHLVDTSCYGFSRQFLINVCNHWHHGWGGDRRFFEIITKHFGHTNFGTTGKHTVNYRLGGNENSPKPTMFIEGNKKMEEKYGTHFPWEDKLKP